MPSRKTVTAVGLVALAIVTAVLVVLALAQGRGNSTAEGRTAVPGVNTSDRAASPSTGAESQGSSESPSAPTSPSTASTSASSASEGTPDGNDASDIRALLRAEEPVTVLVIGDESGAGTAGWVHRWAAGVAEERPVDYQQWDGSAFTEPERLGGASGGVVTIRNASIDGATAGSLAQQLPQLNEPSADIVIINLGGNEQPDTVKAMMTALWEHLGQDTLGAVVVQNAHKQGDPPRQKAAGEQMREWAQEASLPVIDVYGVFLHDSAPLATLLDEGGQIPNASGAKLWAFTVKLTIGP